MITNSHFCQIALSCRPRIAANVVAASRRRGYRNGSDESKECCYLLCVRRDCTPACVKPLVRRRPFTKSINFSFLQIYFCSKVAFQNYILKELFYKFLSNNLNFCCLKHFYSFLRTPQFHKLD